MDTSAWYTRKKKSNNGLSIRTRTKVIRRKHIIQPTGFGRLFLDLLFMVRRGCASAMGMIKFPSSCSSPKALCNQFIDYYICSRGVFCINHIKLRNFVVITIECSIATVDRGSIMTRIYRWSMMVYSSLQAEFMVTKYDVFFDLCLNKRLSKQSCCWWFETPSLPLWRHCNETYLPSVTKPLADIRDNGT